MADKGEEGESITRGNDWEVVSLTASAYAACPDPKQVELKDDEKGVILYDEEASHPLVMSGHFVFEPSGQHKDLETQEDKVSKTIEVGFGVEEEAMMQGKEEEDLSGRGLCLDGFEGIQFEREERVYDAAIGTCIGSDDSRSEAEKKGGESEIPWWKRSAEALYGQAKKANAVWSICVVAAMMGLVMIGQQWQREGWQVLQLKWESNTGNNQKGGRLWGHMCRLKQVLLGGQAAPAPPPTIIEPRN